jgi:decaprenyl-phosphate phosphoribosyltransferase
MKLMVLLFRLLRIDQWVKNLFLLVPIFFAGDLFNINKFTSLLLGFISFSLVASSVYIFNDFKDIKVDKLHPVKRSRPIASGIISIPQALISAVLLLLIGLYLSYLLGQQFFLIITIYLIINLLYSLGLKHVSIVDMFIVSLGFILRILAGGFVAQVAVSDWLIIMIFLLSLFLVLAKRRDDLILQLTIPETVRKTSSTYNLEFINSCLTIFSGIIVVSYIMYTLSSEVINRLNSNKLFITTVFVLAGVMRYLQITFVDQKSGSPTEILIKDKFIIFTIVSWIISFYLIIYAS